MPILEMLNKIKDWPISYEDYNALAIQALRERWTWNGQNVRCSECGYAILKSQDGKIEFCRHEIKQNQ